LHAAGCEALLPHGLGPSAFELSAASAIRHMTYFLLRVRPPSKHRPAELNGFGLMPSDWLEVIMCTLRESAFLGQFPGRAKAHLLICI
jgi:hypothetical protein